MPAHLNNVGYLDSLADLCPGISAGTYIVTAKTSNSEAARVIYIAATQKAIVFDQPYELTEDDIHGKFAWYNSNDTANSNTISEIQVVAGSTAPTQYYPYENIRPIKGRDAVTVERCGENLLNIKPFNKDTYKGITYEYVPDGGIHVSGTALTSVDSPTFPVWFLPPGKYFGLELGPGISASIVVQRNGKNLWLNAKGAFEILAGDVTKYWYAIVSAGATVDKTVYPYIVSGTTAPTTYTPYTGQTDTLTLPETVYGGEVDAVTGEGQETWKMLTLDGTERWADNGIIESKKQQQWAIYRALEPYSGTLCISSHFAKADNSLKYPFNFARVSSSSVVLHVASDGPFATVNDLKSYLAAQYAAGTPVQVCYKLAEPVPFTATGAQPIPALAGANTILTDADSATVTGRADPIKRITDLEDAVASQT